MAKVTLKDIAREVGLSPAAVSLVLNNRPCHISEENRRRIKEVARRKHYIPNEIARSLVMQQSHTLGLVVPNIQSHYFASLANCLELRCRERGYMLLITNSIGSPESDGELVRLLVNRSVDGIFLVVSDEFTRDEELLDILAQLPVPLVMVDRFIEGLAADRVRYNNELGGYLATSYLLEHGHRRIAALINPGSNTGRERLAGYRRALAERDVPFDPQLVFESDYYIPDAWRAAGGLLGTDATAAFASSDNIALGLLKRVYGEGLRVPDDLSVVSYDNSAADSLFEPALTSIEQNVPAISDAAMEMMLGRIEERLEDRDAAEAQERILVPKLVEKDSVRTLGAPAVQAPIGQ
ncbi:MAG: LacI family DNA-binding transcriptional regulator [Atopobiaceae bacterium]